MRKTDNNRKTPEGVWQGQVPANKTQGNAPNADNSYGERSASAAALALNELVKLRAMVGLKGGPGGVFLDTPDVKGVDFDKVQQQMLLVDSLATALGKNSMMARGILSQSTEISAKIKMLADTSGIGKERFRAAANQFRLAAEFAPWKASKYLALAKVAEDLYDAAGMTESDPGVKSETL